MRTIRTLLLLAGLAVLAACGGPSVQTYKGPAVTGIYVDKATRKMFLMHGTTALKTYDIGLGGDPIGPKRFEGDRKTPEGTYYIDRRNPRSMYHLSLGLSYPNANDKAFAEAQNRSPGGDIFIHGVGRAKSIGRGDWTAGCIAVSDEQIEEIYSMVREGTPITIVSGLKVAPTPVVAAPPEAPVTEPMMAQGAQPAATPAVQAVAGTSQPAVTQGTTQLASLAAVERLPSGALLMPVSPPPPPPLSKRLLTMLSLSSS